MNENIENYISIVKQKSDMSPQLIEIIGQLQTKATENPDDPGPILNIAELLTRSQFINAAMGIYRELIKLYPHNGNAYHLLGVLHEQRGEIDEALSLWKNLFNNKYIHSLAVQTMLKSPNITEQQLLEAQKFWASVQAKPNPAKINFQFQPYSGDRPLRIGYVSSFWNSDTFRFIMANVLCYHDRNQVVTFAYSASDASTDLKSCVNHFRITGHLNDDLFIDLVRSDGIDVLVETTGFTVGHRFSAMASRCAPVQVTFLNHTGTTGVPNVDYNIADAISAPIGCDKYFTERIYRLPGSFLCYDYDRTSMPEIADPPCINNGYVTFGCFGSGGKINIRLIQLWSHILQLVPDSQLFLRNMELTSLDNREIMLQKFAQFGISSDRIKIAVGIPRSGILISYADVDISLDTFPYCGGNTVAESLWQGVPVITLKGKRFSSTYGASLVNASGCPELIANNEEDYVQKAVFLSQNKKRLIHYRKNLRKMTKQYGLSDSRAFAQKLEAAYRDMLFQVNNR